MAYDKVIDSAELNANLTAVADAIRTKGGTSEALSFPGGFVSAVEGIQAGGGGDDVLNGVLEGTITEFNNSKLEYLGMYAFTQKQKLVSVRATSVKSMGVSVFRSCPVLESVELPNVTTIGNDSFYGCSKLTQVSMPLLESIGTGAFYNCNVLPFVDLNNATQLGNGFFNNCKALTKVVLRKSDSICRMVNSGVFNGSPFASGGTGGTVYCPASLIEQYQQATNWSTLYAAGTCTFLPIEGSEYE